MPSDSESSSNSASDDESTSSSSVTKQTETKPLEKEEAEGESVISNKTFSELGINEELCSACTALGWTNATAIQSKSLPLTLAGRDVIGLAETGSGKTGSFALPILQNLMVNPQRLYACVLAPTRELAFQIHEVFQGLGQHVGAKSICVVGGVDMMSQAIALANKPHIIVATPGRLVDHLENTKGFNLRQLKYLVMDEADRMLSMDFEEEVRITAIHIFLYFLFAIFVLHKPFLSMQNISNSQTPPRSTPRSSTKSSQKFPTRPPVAGRCSSPRR